MKIGAKLGCHQMADRSFFIGKRQFPICARCTGVLIGYIVAVIMLFIVRISIWVCIVLCLIMFLDWFIQFVGIKKSNNWRRLVTGIIGGFGFLSLEINAAVFMIQKLKEVFI